MNNFTNNKRKSFSDILDSGNSGYLFSREKIQALKKRPAIKKVRLSEHDFEKLEDSKQATIVAKPAFDLSDEDSAQEIIRRRNTPIKECDRSELDQFFNMKFSEMLSIN